jgi:hypothetical protein
MTRLWVGVLAFAVGVAVGLEAAKLYVKSTITSDADSLLSKVGLGGGAVQSFVDTDLVPTLVS